MNQFSLDCLNQHLKHYHEGYREFFLILNHGQDAVENKNIDIDRYSLDSPRRNSYNDGWKQAELSLIHI
jgi:hypothetical protein